MTDEAVRRNLALIRSRMADALAGDPEATEVLNSTFPAEWRDAPLAAVWLLGNAARFCGERHDRQFSQGWLDRLVWPDGEPRDA